MSSSEVVSQNSSSSSISTGFIAPPEEFPTGDRGTGSVLVDGDDPEFASEEFSTSDRGTGSVLVDGDDPEFVSEDFSTGDRGTGLALVFVSLGAGRTCSHFVNVRSYPSSLNLTL